MKEEDYSNYGFRDLARDYAHDYNYVKEKIQFFLKLKKRFTLFQTIWSYVTAVLFVLYGVRWYVKTGEVVLTTAIISVSAVYAILTTVILLTRGDEKERKKRQSKVRKAFKYVSFAIKLTIIVITIVSVILGKEETGFTILVSVFTLVWIMLSVTVDVAVFFINRTIKMLKEMVEREAKRAKAAFKNTTGMVGTGFSQIASGAKGLFKKLFDKPGEPSPDDGDGPGDDPFDELGG